MIWNPIISIIIFLVIMIPSIWIGFKKGWKSALLISLTLILLNFIVLGIGILLYDQIWYLYKTLLLKNNNKISIDLNVLKGAYKPRVLLLLNLFSMPIIVLITWCIHLITKNVLTKHWLPKTQKISKNNKKILIASNSKKSKIIGGGILTLSSIFISSFVVSGTNVLTMPLHRKNFFSKGTDWLGNIYSAGIANNSDVPFYIDNFMENADNDVTQGLSSLISFVDLKNASDIDNELKKAQVIREKNSLFNELFKSPEASSKIIESILANDDKFINPLLWNEDVYKAAPDKYGNEQGYNDSLLSNGNKRIMFLEQLKSYLSLNPFKYSMPQEVKNVYIKLFKKYIDNWEQTKFFRYLKVAQKYIDKNNKDLKDKKSEYDKIRNQKIKLTKERKERINFIQKLMSRAWIDNNLIETQRVYKNVQNFDDPNKLSESEWKELTWVDGFNMVNTYFAKGSNNISGTEIDKQYKIFDDYKQVAIDKRTLASNAEQKRSFKEQNFLTTNTSSYDYDSAKKLLNSLETDLNDNKNELAAWKQDRLNRVNRLNEINTSFVTLKNDINYKNTELNKLQMKLSLEKNVLKNLRKEEGIALTNYNDSVNDFNIEKNAFDLSQNNYLSEKSKLQNLNNSLDQEKVQLSKYKNELNVIKSQLSNLDINDPNYTNLSSKEQSLQSNIKIIESSIRSYGNQINIQENVVKSSKAAMDRNEKEKEKKLIIRDANYSIYSNKTSKASAQQIKVNSISINEANLKNEISSLISQRNDLNTEKNILVGSVNTAGSIKEATSEEAYFNGKVINAKRNYDDFKQSYDPEYNAYMILKRKRDAANNIAKNAEKKRDDQDKKIKKSINDVINAIARIDQDNKDIKAKANEISTYDNLEVFIILKNNSEDYQLLFSKDNKEEKLLSKISSNAKKSLGYFEAKLNAMKKRLKTSLTINEGLKRKFSQTVEKIGNIYSDWINKK